MDNQRSSLESTSPSQTQPKHFPSSAASSTGGAASTSATATGSGSGRVAKRHQVQVACLACQRRKSKCDAARPRCAACERRDTNCTYDVEENETRAVHMKRKAQELSVENEDFRYLFDTLRSTSAEEGTELLRRIRAQHSLKDIVQLVKDSSALLTNSPPSEIAYPSDRLMSQPHITPLKRKDLTGYLQAGSVRLHDQPLFQARLHSWTTVIEEEELMAHLISLYFTWEDPLWCFLDRCHFLEDLNSGGTTYCSRLLVNAMLSQACHLSQRFDNRADPGDKTSLSNKFFNEAYQLWREEVGRNDITTVQAGAILTMVCFADGRDALGWTFLSTAFNMASNMDLFRPVRSVGDQAGRDRDMERVRSITAWGLHNYSSVIVLGIHRPPFFGSPLEVARHPPSNTSNPSIDRTNGIWSPYPHLDYSRTPNRQETFEAQSTLATITNQMAFVLYGNGHAPNAYELSPQHGYAIYQRLHEWQKSLPDSLNPLYCVSTPHIGSLHMHFETVLQTLLRAVVTVEIPSGLVDPETMSEPASANSWASIVGVSPHTEDPAREFGAKAPSTLALSKERLHTLLFLNDIHLGWTPSSLTSCHAFLAASTNVMRDVRATTDLDPNGPLADCDTQAESKLAFYVAALKECSRSWFIHKAVLRVMHMNLRQMNIKVPSSLLSVFDDIFDEHQHWKKQVGDIRSYWLVGRNQFEEDRSLGELLVNFEGLNTQAEISIPGRDRA
ncbi:hypothetical protein MMC25_004866 [Agyrium rufum]|nr:hypothetical protein [Agyrium rufum]